jgi:hypothetical protein
MNKPKPKTPTKGRNDNSCRVLRDPIRYLGDKGLPTPAELRSPLRPRDDAPPTHHGVDEQQR